MSPLQITKGRVTTIVGVFLILITLLAVGTVFVIAFKVDTDALINGVGHTSVTIENKYSKPLIVDCVVYAEGYMVGKESGGHTISPGGSYVFTYEYHNSRRASRVFIIAREGDDSHAEHQFSNDYTFVAGRYTDVHVTISYDKHISFS
jgi:hypothetical protein